MINKKKSVELDILARGLAHELRNPLASIKTLAQVALKRSDSKDTEIYLYKIISEVERMNNLIEMFFSLSHGIEASTSTHINISETIEKICYLLAPLMEEGGIIFKIDKTGLKKDFFDLNVDIFYTVVVNLLTNAMEAVGRNNNGYIEFVIYEQNNKLIMEVTDNGPGIPKELEEKIYQPFFTTKSTGKGLGLSLVKARLEQIGGHITHINIPEGGCRFVVSFPIEKNKNNNK